MTKEEFKAEYNAILSRALAVNEKVRRYGIESLEENIDKVKCEKKDVFEYGLRLAIDKKKPKEIEQILAEIVNKEADKDKKKLMEIKMNAIIAIREEWNTRLLMLLINSYVSLDIHDLSKEEIPHYESICPDPKDAVYKIYEHVEGFEELLVLEDDFIKRLMRELDSQLLAKAIRHADKKFKDVFFRNMSERAVDMLWEDIEYIGEVEPLFVKHAQEDILEKLAVLKEENK
jgi:hypothetical protein